VRCKLYFTLAFHCGVMGYLELLLKVIEAIMTVLVVLSLALMKVCPWRKANLAKHLKDGNPESL
jgi:hypothetical protein